MENYYVSFIKVDKGKGGGGQQRWNKKIPHTGDTESLDQCGYYHHYQEERKKLYRGSIFFLFLCWSNIFFEVVHLSFFGMRSKLFVVVVCSFCLSNVFCGGVQTFCWASKRNKFAGIQLFFCEESTFFFDEV